MGFSRGGLLVCLAFLVAPPGPGWLRSTLRAQEPVDLDSLGYPRGETGAPVTIVEFGDFGCLACAEFAIQTWADFHSEFIQTGIVAWRFVPFVLGSFRNSQGAATAAECVADLAPEAFWTMHHVLYERQADWNRRRRPKEELRSLAEGVGVDGDAFDGPLDDLYPFKQTDAWTDAPTGRPTGRRPPSTRGQRRRGWSRPLI